MIRIDTIKTLISFFFESFGFKITKKKNEIIKPGEFNAFKNDRDWKLIIKSKNNFEKKKTDFLTDVRFYSLIQIINNVLSQKNPSNFAELGCWNGHSSSIIAYLIKKRKKKINFFIFDSFEGLSNLNQNDKSDFIIKENFIGNFRKVKKRLKNFNFIKIYPGWIPEKFYNVKKKKFSFVHIDLCLYQPTLDSLNFFYPRLKKGGIIVSNSYNSKVFPGEGRAWDSFFKKNKYSFMCKYALNSCFVIK